MTEEEHLQNLLNGVEKATQKTRTITAGLNPRQLMWKPGPDIWSIAECFEHLILTGDGWYPQIRSVIAEAEPNTDSRDKEYRPAIFGKFFLWISGKKVPFNIKTHQTFQPKDNVAPDAHERFMQQQPVLQKLIEDSWKLNLKKNVVRFPFTSLLRLRLGDALRLMIDHQFRHLSQAEEVRLKIDSQS